MNTRISNSSVAIEHLRDSADNLRECVSTIKRVMKSYPDLAGPLTNVVQRLEKAKVDIEGLKQHVPRG
jgi:hypothetical protein